MRGWFDSFRTDGGPTLYSYSNRTPVTGDPTVIVLYVVFTTLFLAFIIVFPGIRKERFTTFTSVTLSLFVGAVILVCKYGSSWHVADTSIMSYYRAFSREKLAADIGVSVGLSSVNVTLKGLSRKNTSLADEFNDEVEDIDYNERFHWDSATEVQEEFREALVKGLPYPILSVVEYFNLDDEGFCWGRNYRLAGYYGSIMLWASFASWLLMNLLLVVVPRYGAYMMCLTGGLMLSTNALYYLLIPAKPLVIRFEDNFLMFKFGWSFWGVLIAGALCSTVGGIIAIVDWIWPHKFSTVLEVDYDTPYDRHIIIEESTHQTRKKKGGKRSLEEPDNLGLGKKILRTLSKQDKSELTFTNHHLRGLDNQSFEMDPPKSPWRYPHHMMFNPDGTPAARMTLANAITSNPALARLAAPTITKPQKSVSFRRQSKLEQFAGDPRIKRSDSNDSTASSTSSSGIGIQNENSDELPMSFQSQFIKLPVERTESRKSERSGSEESIGLNRLIRSQSALSPLGNTKANMPLTIQKSSPGFSGDQNHIPLTRIHYNHQHVGLHHIPRASIERKGSEESSSPGSKDTSRRGSGNSTASSSSSRSRGSSGFSSTSIDFSKQPRNEPDGHENSSQSSRGSTYRIREKW